MNKLNRTALKEKARRGLLAASFLVPLLLLWAAPAVASTSGGGMPWDGPLNTLADDIQGPVVTTGLIFAIVIGCLLLAFGDFATGGKRIVLTVIAGSIALGIIRFFSALGLVGALLR
jgi:type IV secretion system protein TrbC